jgi:hypothetical protein
VTLGWRRRRRGARSADQARHRPKGNIIIRALGVREQITLDRLIVPFTAGEQVMLCSDGMSRSSRRRTTNRSQCTTSPTLIAHALMRNGTDNTSLCWSSDRAAERAYAAEIATGLATAGDRGRFKISVGSSGRFPRSAPNVLRWVASACAATWSISAAIRW